MKTNRITKLSLRTLLNFIGVLTLALFVQQTVSHADPFAIIQLFSMTFGK